MPDADLHDRIRLRAYLLWEEEGRPEGKAEEHWLRAEAEVTGVNPGGHAPPGTPGAGEHVCPAPAREPGGSAAAGARDAAARAGSSIFPNRDVSSPRPSGCGLRSGSTTGLPLLPLPRGFSCRSCGWHAGMVSRGPVLHDAAWQADIDLKLMAAVRLCRAVIPIMRARGGGGIVNTTIVGGKAPAARPRPSSVTRAAGFNLTKLLATEYATTSAGTPCASG